MANPIGRPTDYTQELADEMCSQLSEGISLRTVCLADKMPDKSTVFRWLRTYPEFNNQYEKAKEEAADAFVEEMQDIADNGTNDWIDKEMPDGSVKKVLNTEHVQRSRLRIDTRKWVASKLKAKKYGEKMDVTSDGKALPTPIIPLNVLSRDDSNSEDIGA